MRRRREVPTLGVNGVFVNAGPMPNAAAPFKRSIWLLRGALGLSASIIKPLQLLRIQRYKEP